MRDNVSGRSAFVIEQSIISSTPAPRLALHGRSTRPFSGPEEEKAATHARMLLQIGLQRVFSQFAACQTRAVSEVSGCMRGV